MAPGERMAEVDQKPKHPPADPVPPLWWWCLRRRAVGLAKC